MKRWQIRVETPQGVKGFFNFDLPPCLRKLAPYFKREDAVDIIDSLEKLGTKASLRRLRKGEKSGPRGEAS